MALISCPDCDNQCSTTAVSCPKCGHRFTKKINLAEGLSALGAFGTSIKDKIRTKPKKYSFPLSVGKHFILSEESITYKGTRYKLPSDVKRFHSESIKHSVSFVPAGNTSILLIEMLDGTNVAIGTSNLNSQNRKKLVLAASYIGQLTRPQRYNRYLTKLIEEKQLAIKRKRTLHSNSDIITIYSNGYISKGRKKINLVESYEKGYLKEGVQFGVPGATWSGTKPSALLIGANGTGTFSKKIIVEFKYDSDVLNQLILDIAKNPIH